VAHTVEAIIYANSGSTGNNLTIAARGLNVGLNTAGNFYASTYDWSVRTATGTTAIAAGNTYVLHAVLSGGTLRLYVNGVEEASVAVPNPSFIEFGSTFALSSLAGYVERAVRIIGGGTANNVAWSPGMIQARAREPWSFLEWPEERLFAAVRRAASIVSVSLTGVAMTASAGTLTSAVGMDAGGEAATGSAGSVGAAIGVAASGSAATASAGTPTSAIAMSASGVSMTVSAGSLTYSLAFTLTGVASTSASGTLAADKGSVGRTLTGISMTALPGNVRVTGGTRWRPSEAQAVTPPSMVGNTLQPPPRLVGDPAADNRAIQQWLQTLYDHVIKRDNVLGRIADHETRIAAIEASNDNGST